MKAEVRKKINEIEKLRKEQREGMYELMIVPFDRIIKICEDTKKGKLSVKVFVKANRDFGESLKKITGGLK